MEVIPTITTNEVEKVKWNLEMANAAGDVVKWMQYDMIDGVFADNLTLPLDVIRSEELAVLSSRFLWEAHLMVQAPIDWVERCATAKMDRVIAHVEMMENQLAFVDEVERLGMEVGLAIDGGSALEAVDDGVWQWLDVVLVMGIDAGFTGQVFQRKTLEKISQLKELRRVGGYVFKIEVDGGVNLETVGEIVDAGADLVCGNSAVYRDGLVRENIMKLMDKRVI